MQREPPEPPPGCLSVAWSWRTNWLSRRHGNHPPTLTASLGDTATTPRHPGGIAERADLGELPLSAASSTLPSHAAPTPSPSPPSDPTPGRRPAGELGSASALPGQPSPPPSHPWSLLTTLPSVFLPASPRCPARTEQEFGLSEESALRSLALSPSYNPRSYQEPPLPSFLPPHRGGQSVGRVTRQTLDSFAETGL